MERNLSIFSMLLGSRSIHIKGQGGKHSKSSGPVQALPHLSLCIRVSIETDQRLFAPPLQCMPSCTRLIPISYWTCGLLLTSRGCLGLLSPGSHHIANSLKVKRSIEQECQFGNQQLYNKYPDNHPPTNMRLCLPQNQSHNGGACGP